MEQIILNVLKDMTTNQVNLGSKAAREVIANSITEALESNGTYKQHTEIELEKQEAKKDWVCQTCGKSTFETEYDYLVHPKLHLGCALEEELKGKDIKEQYHKASKSYFNDKNKEHVGTAQKGGRVYIYESPDRGKTIYRREFEKSDREVVDDWKKKIGERKEMVENSDKKKWSGKYEDFTVKEEQVDERAEKNLKWYKNWKRDSFKNEENSTQNR